MVVCVGNELRFQGLGSKMLTSFSLPPSSFRAICLCRPRPTFADRGVSASSKYLFPYMTGQGAPTNPAPPMFGREPLRRPYSLPGSSIPKQLSGGHFGGGGQKLQVEETRVCSMVGNTCSPLALSSYRCHWMLVALVQSNRQLLVVMDRDDGWTCFIH